MKSKCFALVATALVTLGVTSSALASELARDNTKGSFAHAYGSLGPSWDNEYDIVPLAEGTVFTVRVTAPTGQKIKAKWDVRCSKGTSSRDNSGVLARRGSFVFSRKPSLVSAEQCTFSVSAERAYGSRGRLIVVILGR